MKQKLKNLPFEVPIKFNPNDLDFLPIFKSMFRRDEDRIKNIAKDMKKKKYDPAFMIRCIIHDNKVVVFDGHHKAEAGKLADIDVIIIVYNMTISEAYADAREKQGLARKLDNSELFQHVVNSLGIINCKNSPNGENKETVKHEIVNGLCVGARTVDRCYKIIEDGTQEQKEKVLNGKKTINATYNEIMTAQKPKKEKKEITTEWKKDSLYAQGRKILEMNPGYRYGNQKKFLSIKKKIEEIVSEVLK